MQHLTDYYILYLLLICRIFLKYGTGNVMNNSICVADKRSVSKGEVSAMPTADVICVTTPYALSFVLRASDAR